MKVFLAQAQAGSYPLLQKVTDHPWPGWQVELLGMKLTLMSGAISAMILAAAFLAVVVPLAARRHQQVPRGAGQVIEVVVVFVRDMIARPALHERAYEFLPFLLTLFVFILTVNLLGIVPLEPLSELLAPWGVHRIGGAAASVPSVAGGLAAISFGAIVFCGLKQQTRRCRDRRNWPMWLCAALSPLLWLKSLAPQAGGRAGLVMLVPLAVLELVGVIAKCFALMVRLFANMISGHVLLAVMMMFIALALQQQMIRVAFIGPACVLASVVLELLELLVASLQAYIFTFLTAMFLSLYSGTAH